MREENGEKYDVEAENADFEQTVTELCKQYNIKCHFTNSEFIMITTRAGYWRLEYWSNGTIKIYHNNYNPELGLLYKKSGRFDEGFHIHKINVQNIKEALEYIYIHDTTYLDPGN